ncbi:MAG: PH domain-containing protein [Frankiaceae bacterium]|nr:PH domain-containing protein [Frankiaceae bacterium]
MDTLIIRVPRQRAYGLLALAAVLVVVAVLSDPAGRLLTLPAAVAVLALAVRDLRSGPVLRAGPAGVEVLQGARRLRVGWDRVERMRVVKDRRTEMLELDLGSTLALLSRHRLGRLPADVLTDLLAIRASVSR